MSNYSNHLFTPGAKNNSWSHLYDYIKEGSRVLDVGCSSGHFGEALIQLKNCEVVGIDLDNDDVKAAKKILTAAYVADVNDMTTMKKYGKFDIIIFADVIEHLVQPRVTLHNMKSLLNKNGRIVFSIPHMAHISVRLDLLAGSFPYKDKGLLDKTHLHFYDHNEVKSVFEDSGYQIKKMDPVVSEYPEQLINKKLSKVGLLSTPEFIKKIHKTDANIFQFIGYAQPASTVKNELKKRDVYTMPQDEIMDYTKEILKENKRLWSDQQKTLHRNIELENHMKTYLRIRHKARFLGKLKHLPNRKRTEHNEK